MDWILREHFTCYLSKPGTQQIYIINLMQTAGMESKYKAVFHCSGKSYGKHIRKYRYEWLFIGPVSI